MQNAKYNTRYLLKQYCTSSLKLLVPYLAGMLPSAVIRFQAIAPATMEVPVACGREKFRRQRGQDRHSADTRG